MSSSAMTTHTSPKSTQPCHRHVTIEDIFEDEAAGWSEQSSPSTSPQIAARSSLEFLMADEVLLARAANMILQPGKSNDSAARAIGPHIRQLSVPRNFAQVMQGMYRSAYPAPENFSFMRVLGLKTILTLVPEEYSPEHFRFIVENRIQHFQIGIEPNKSPFVTINQCNIAAALRVVLDPTNRPLLIHCNKGKHRTGCVVACMRKVLGWDLEDILAEYRKYAGAKARVLDERYIELFDERALRWMIHCEEARYQRIVPEPYVSTTNLSPSASTRLRS